MATVRLGGSCEMCGLPQLARAASCTRSRSECPYGKEANQESTEIVNQASAHKPLRIARMLKLYVATHDALTQKQVAQQAGVSESTLSRFLSGDQMPDGRSFAALVAWCLGEHDA